MMNFFYPIYGVFEQTPEGWGDFMQLIWAELGRFFLPFKRRWKAYYTKLSFERKLVHATQTLENMRNVVAAQTNGSTRENHLIVTEVRYDAGKPNPEPRLLKFEDFENRPGLWVKLVLTYSDVSPYQQGQKISIVLHLEKSKRGLLEVCRNPSGKELKVNTMKLEELIDGWRFLELKLPLETKGGLHEPPIMKKELVLKNYPL